MLKLRILTALLLIPLVLSGIYLLSSPIFSLVVLGVMLIGAYEWAGLMGLTRWIQKGLYIVLVGIIMGMSWYFDLYHYQPAALIILLLTSIGWIFAYYTVLRYRPDVPIFSWMPACAGMTKAGMTIIGLWVLVPTWLSLSYLHSLSHGPNILMGLLLITWIADSGAYFAGRLMGKHLLLPQVSPKKTWEGFWGGFVSTGIFAVIAYYFYAMSAWWYLLVAITVLYAVLGDLFESMIKRKVGVKDSGQLLPGHGGLLDRIDSLLAAAPVFALGWMIWQI